MRLRSFGLIVTLALGIFSAPLAAEAQPAGKVYRIGSLWPTARSVTSPYVRVFEERLRELGYVEGRNITFEHRFAEGKLELLPGMAAELARLKVDALVTIGNPVTSAAKQATTTIPIVMGVVADPVGAGLVTSLARPGGNVTGLTVDVSPEIWGKHLEILKDVVPRVSRVAIFWNPAYSPNRARWEATRDAARRLGVTLLSAEVRAPIEVESAFASVIGKRADGLTVFGDHLLFSLRGQIAELAAKNRLPSIYPWREVVEAGGLVCYGVNFYDMSRRAAEYVDRILKGAKPADLPVEQPTKFELVINMKTAKALGLTIPPSVLIRADQVIQ